MADPIDTAQERARLATNEAILHLIPSYLDAIDAERAENRRLRLQVEELDFLRHEGGPQSVAAIEASLRELLDRVTDAGCEKWWPHVVERARAALGEAP